MEYDETKSMQILAAEWTKAQPAVAAFIRAIVRDFHQSEEILQKTAMTLVVKFGEYDADQPFVAWAIGIAKIEVLRWRQQQQRDRLVFDEEPIHAIADAYESMIPELGELQQAMLHCIDRLTGRLHEVLKLRLGESLSPRETAERLKLSLNAVDVAMHRARQKVRQCVEKQMNIDLKAYRVNGGSHE